MKQLHFPYLSAVMLLLLFCGAGCNNTPFAPIAVPNASSLRPEPEKISTGAESIAELKRLHHVRPAEYRISPGDVYAILIHGREDMSRGQVTVLSDGAISVMPIGYVKIGGLTIPEASALLSEKYRKYIKDCEVVLEPVTIQPSKVTVIGAVGSPGVYPVSSGVTRLTDVIALAGGPLSTTTDENEPLLLSDLEEAYIMRDGRILPVNFASVLTRGDWTHNIPVMNNDYIYVPSLENCRVTVLGEVEGPDNLVFQPNLTVLQAIAKAGGLKDSSLRTIKVIRGGLKNPVVYNMDVKELQTGKLMDFALKPADIIYVPKDPITEWNVILKELMVTVQFLNGVAGPFGSPAMLYNK